MPRGYMSSPVLRACKKCSVDVPVRVEEPELFLFLEGVSRL